MNTKIKYRILNRNSTEEAQEPQEEVGDDDDLEPEPEQDGRHGGTYLDEIIDVPSDNGKFSFRTLWAFTGTLQY